MYTKRASLGQETPSPTEQGCGYSFVFAQLVERAAGTKSINQVRASLGLTVFSIVTE